MPAHPFLANAGAAIQSSASPGEALALLQWGAFVLPTLYFSWQQRYDLRRTFGLNPCRMQWLVAAAAAGPALYLVVTTLVQLRLGGLDQAAALSASGMGSSPGWPVGPTSLGSLLPTYIISPAGELALAAASTGSAPCIGAGVALLGFPLLKGSRQPCCTKRSLAGVLRLHRHSRA